MQKSISKLNRGFYIHSKCPPLKLNTKHTCCKLPLKLPVQRFQLDKRCWLLHSLFSRLLDSVSAHWTRRFCLIIILLLSRSFFRPTTNTTKAARKGLREYIRWCFAGCGINTAYGSKGLKIIVQDGWCFWGSGCGRCIFFACRLFKVGWATALTATPPIVLFHI